MCRDALVVLGERAPESRKQDRKHEGVHADRHRARLARHKEPTGPWGNCQENSRSQENKENGRHDEICSCQICPDDKLGNNIVQKDVKDRMEQNLLHRTGPKTKDESWAQKSKENRGHKNFGACNIYHLYIADIFIEPAIKVFRGNSILDYFYTLDIVPGPT